MESPLKVHLFDEAKIIFRNIDSQKTSFQPKAIGEINYCIGQLVFFDVEIPISKQSLQNVKLPHPPRSPASTNLLKCFLRHLSSTVEVKAWIYSHQRDSSIRCNDDRHKTSVWYSCSLESSRYHASDKGIFKTETYLKDGKIYTIPFQKKLKNIPPTCNSVDIVVEIREGQRQGPGWLSSPTRPDTVLLTAENKVRQSLKVIQPPTVQFQHRSLGGKQLFLLQVSNNTSQPVNVEDCCVLPDSCPVKLCKQPSDLQSDGSRKPCLIHGSMVKLVYGESSVLPVKLLSGENLSLMFNLHLVGGADYLSKEEIPFTCHLKWTIPNSSCHSQSDILSVFSLPTVKIKQAHFVMTAKCKEDIIHPGDSFTVHYSVSNRLQDFLSVKLYWSPTPNGTSADEAKQLEYLKQGLSCCDPQVQLGACPYGSIMQAQVRYQALRPGLYEVCKHMKINLRYLIPTEGDQIASPASHGSSQSGEDRLTSEEIWRERSGSGSSFREPEGLQSEDRRLSLANKSYSVGDLVDKIQSPKLKSSDTRKLLFTMGTQSGKYEQVLLNPENFLKNCCEVYVSPSRSKQNTESVI